MTYKFLPIPCGLLVSCTVLLASCSTLSHQNINEEARSIFVDEFPKAELSDLAQLSRQDVFKTGDTVNVQVFNVDELSRIYTVDRLGLINFPLIGNVKVANLNTSQLRSELESKYGETYLQNPSISVTIEQQALGKIAIDGAVREPGVLEIFEIASVSEVVAMAGGLTEDANIKEIFLVRKLNDERKVLKVNLEAIRQEGKLDPEVYPNDIVFIQNNKVRIAYKEFLRTVPLISALLIASTR